MVKLFCLIDYRKNFWTRHYESPYRSGFIQDSLVAEFAKDNYELIFLRFSDVKKFEMYQNEFVIYTSIEDEDLFYKSFIEDVILGLELAGAKVIPSYIHLRAHHNKVFMEILRKILLNDTSIKSEYYGSIQDLLTGIPKNFPKVVKASAGSTSKSVYLARDESSLLRLVKKISNVSGFMPRLKELIRKVKYVGYIQESQYRKKFLVQDFLSGLEGDYKILVFGIKYFVLWRLNRENDFRASGSGNFLFTKELPDGLLNFAHQVFEKLKVPHVSLDIVKTSSGFVVIEFQTVTFGTYTLEASDFHYEWVGKDWNCLDGKVNLEQVYSDSIKWFISGNINKA